MLATARNVPYEDDSYDAATIGDALFALASWVNDHPGVRVATTAQRNAYAGADLWTGKTIWNTDTGQMETYNGASWGPPLSNTGTYTVGTVQVSQGAVNSANAIFGVNANTAIVGAPVGNNAVALRPSGGGSPNGQLVVSYTGAVYSSSATGTVRNYLDDGTGAAIIASTLFVGHAGVYGTIRLGSSVGAGSEIQWGGDGTGYLLNIRAYNNAAAIKGGAQVDDRGMFRTVTSAGAVRNILDDGAGNALLTGDLVINGLLTNLTTDSKTLTYTGGLLTQVVESRAGVTVKTTMLTYTGGLLTQVVEDITPAGETAHTITTTLSYTSGVLTSVTRAVT